MKTTLRKVYECEHCRKKMLGAGAMSRHEKYCRENPNNEHKCFDFCKHLIKGRETLQSHGEPYCSYVTFHCDKLNKGLYSYKLEKNVNAKPTYFNELERMPLECDSFESMHWTEIEELNN